MQTTGCKPPDILSSQHGISQTPQTTDSNDGLNNVPVLSVTNLDPDMPPDVRRNKAAQNASDHNGAAREVGRTPRNASIVTPPHSDDCDSSRVSVADRDSTRDPFSDGHPTPGPDADLFTTTHVVQAESGDTFNDGVAPNNYATPLNDEVEPIEDDDAGAHGSDTPRPPMAPSCIRTRCPCLAGPVDALMASAANLVSRARGMTWRQIVFVSVLVALVMVGNFMQILMLNFWLVSFPADGAPGNYTAFAVPGILFSLFFVAWCVGYIVIRRPNLSFAKHRYGWTLLVSIGFCDTFNSWLATYAASYTSEVLQALFTNLSPLYAVFMSKWILKDPRKYFNPWIISVFVLTITGILAASLYGIIKEGKHMEDGQLWILIFFSSIPLRVLQNVLQSLYMIVYTKDESFTFWLRNRLALKEGVADRTRKRRKGGKGAKKRNKSVTGQSATDGMVDLDDEDDDVGARQVGKRDSSIHQARSRNVSRLKRTAEITDKESGYDEDDDAGEDGDTVLDERALAHRLLHDHSDASSVVPMILHAPPPSMAASFSRNPDLGNAVSNTAIAQGLLPREPSLVALGNGSDIHIHNDIRSAGFSSGTPSVVGSGPRSVREQPTPAPAAETGAEAEAPAAPVQEDEEVVAVRYHQGEDTIVKLVMLAGETVAQVCFTLALLPADALPWWGNSDSVANTWSNFLEGIICVFTMPKNFLFGCLYTLGFVFTYVGGAYLNHYSVALCSIVTQLSSPLTALVLVLVPSWNVMEGGDSPWFCSVIAIVFLSVAALLYVMWEEKTDEEKIEGERVLKMNKLHVRPIEDELEHVEVSIVSSD